MTTAQALSTMRFKIATANALIGEVITMAVDQGILLDHNANSTNANPLLTASLSLEDFKKVIDYESIKLY